MRDFIEELNTKDSMIVEFYGIRLEDYTKEELIEICIYLGRENKRLQEDRFNSLSPFGK